MFSEENAGSRVGNFARQLAAVILFVAGSALMLFIFILSAILAPIAVLYLRLKFGNEPPAAKVRHKVDPDFRDRDVIEGKYSVVDK